MNAEDIRNDLAPDIEKLKKLQILGDRIIVLLDLAEDTTTESGIIIPLNELQETDGGKLKTRPSAKRHLSQGTILSIGDQAASQIKEKSLNLNVNDKVYLTQQALSNSFNFFPDRTKLVQDFKGFVAVPLSLIEAKL